MSNRIYKTDKVDHIIGMNNKSKYDKIELFSERLNHDNILAIAYYTENIKGKIVEKKDVIAFPSYLAMMSFLENNFNTYEINNYVPIEQKKVFFHFVDFRDVNYYSHNGKPDKNYVTLNYIEYINNMFYPGSIKLSKEYEKLLLSVANRGKPQVNQPKYANAIDVYEQRREDYHKYTKSVGDSIRKSGEKLLDKKNKEKIVKGLRIISGIVILTSALSGGYVLAKGAVDNIVSNRVIIDNGGIKNVKDIDIVFKSSKADNIIDKLMQSKYDEVTEEEVDFIFDYIDSIDNSNYNEDNSYNVFDLDNYFDYYIYKQKNHSDAHEMLEKIERLYKKMFFNNGNRIEVNQEAAKEYIDYVSSFTFRYNTYRKTRPTNLVRLDGNTINYDYENERDIETFDSLPPLLRIVILNQLKGVVSHSKVESVTRTAYYFDGLDKNEVLNIIRDTLINEKDALKTNCKLNIKSGK